MGGGSVPAVTGKSVFRKSEIQRLHDTIPVDLGKDTGGGNGEAVGITFDNPLRGNRKIRHRQAVDESVVRGRGEGPDRTGHGEMGGPENVQGIDLRDAGFRDPETQPGAGLDSFGQVAAADVAQGLGVIDPEIAEPVGENHGGGHHRTGQRPPPGFIDPGNLPDPLTLQGPLPSAVGTDRLFAIHARSWLGPGFFRRCHDHPNCAEIPFDASNGSG